MKIISRITIFLLILGLSFVKLVLIQGQPSAIFLDNLLEQVVNAAPGYAFKKDSLKSFFSDTFDDTLKHIPPKKAVERVRQGMGLTTHTVQYISGKDRPDFQQKYIIDMIGEGLVTVLFDLVNQCGENKIRDVAKTKEKFPFSPRRPIKSYSGIVEGYLYNPGILLDILVNLVGRSELPIDSKQMFRIKRKVARSLGPLIECLKDDTKREYFQINEYWHDAHISLMSLLTHLVGIRGFEDYSPKIIPIVIEYDGLIEMLVKCIFWGEYRNDIVKESYRNTVSMATMGNYAGSVIEQFMLLGEKQDNPVAVYYRDGI